MKILFLVRDKNHPAPRYRVLQYLPYLNLQGIQSEVANFPSSFVGWWQIVRRLSDFDIVFIQKKRVQPFWLKRLKSKARVIYDFDDAVMYNSSRHPNPDSPLRMAQFVNTLKNVDGVIAGNDYLKLLAVPHNPKVWVLPTSIETSRYPIRETKASPEIILGWVGGSKSLVFLKTLSIVLDRLYERYPNLRLKIVCNEFFDCARMPVIKKQWSGAEEINDILSFDIGLAPLPDDPWSRGKCATKLLQCMAAGVPSVSAPVGVHKEIVQEGVNGFLARNDDEWIDRIGRLVENETLRRQIGQAGRQTVEKDYSVNASTPKLVALFNEVCG